MPNLEQLEKQLKEHGEQIEALKIAKTLSDSIGKISVDISKAADEAAFKAIDSEISKLDKSDVRVGVLTDMLKAAEAKVAADKKAKQEAADAAAAKAAEGETDEMAKKLSPILKENAELKSDVAIMKKDAAIKKLLDNELKDLVGKLKTDELAESVYKLRMVDAGSAEVMLSVIKSLTAQVKEAGLFKTIGGDGNPGGSTEAKLEDMAKALAKKDNISYQKAYARILDENPEMYSNAQSEAKSK